MNDQAFTPRLGDGTRLRLPAEAASTLNHDAPVGACMGKIIDPLTGATYRVYREPAGEALAVRRRVRA